MFRYRSALSLLACLVVLVLPNNTYAFQAEVTNIATPEPISGPRFGLVAVGNYPNGYFDDVVVEPGSTVELTVKVINVGEIPVNLSTFKVNARSDVNGGYVSGNENDLPSGATPWIDYPTQFVDLEPGGVQEIDFSVTVPEDAQPGQYMAGLVAQVTEDIDIPGSDVLDYTIGYAISIGVLVPGEMTQNFELGEADLTLEGSTRRLVIPVVNTGNYLVRPAGQATLTNTSGENVMTSPVEMGSVYGGLSTTVSILLPEQMAPGEYVLNLDLTDEESGATDSIRDVTVTVPEPVDPTGVSVISTAIEPNAEEIVFANIDVTLNNGGQQIPASNVTLNVMRNGDVVEEFALATNQVLLNGENTFTSRYIPAEMWESGTYTFNIVVSAVDPNGGQETILLDEELDATIVVP